MGITEGKCLIRPQIQTLNDMKDKKKLGLKANLDTLKHDAIQSVSF